jgi:hypothetical protein
MIPSFLRPNGLFKLERIGSDNDGGYLVDPESIIKSDALLSFGIAKNWSFEEDFLERNNIVIHAYDFSVDKIFWLKHFVKRFLAILILKFSAPFKAIKLYFSFKKFFSSKAVFFQEKIGINHPNTSFSKALNRIKKSNVFLKIDIEGSEYEILDEILKSSDKLTGLVIEFHDIQNNFHHLENFIKSINLELIHFHPNNNRRDENDDPKVIELTFSKFSQKVGDKFNYPHPLDQENVKRKEPINLNFTD